MTEAKTCPKCGDELPPDAPEGICPNCLILAGLESNGEPQEQLENGSYESTMLHPEWSSIPDPDILAPHFPHLELLEPLGHGGMGAVYKARQPKLNRLVALKIIRPESADDPAFAERFNREARTLARLNDPNIVAVYDFGEVTVTDDHSGENPKTLYYFLMEYVDGANLRQMMDRGELSPDRTLQIVPQICDALQFAHDEGVVHRDIKPENILVDSRGRVKIADFGLAKLASPSEQDFTLTGTHQVMGTPRYMAPEQMAGSRAVDHRADLYSLGVVFYEMLTGEIPAGHFSRPSAQVAIDGRLDDVVMKALAQKPEDRFQSVSEIRSSLETIVQDETGSVLSEPEVSEPPLARGFSTIFEREIGAAWNWVVHPEQPNRDSGQAATAAFPVLLFITLAVLGGLTMFLPWAEIHVDQGVDVSRIVDVSGFVEDAELERPVVEPRSGTDNWSSAAAPITCLVLVLVIALAPSRKSPGIILSGVLALLSVVALIHSVAFTQEVKHQPAITLPLKISSQTDEFASDSGNPQYDPETGIFRQRLAPHLVEHRVIYQSGFYAALGISLTLVLLNVVAIRNAILNREPKPKTAESWSGTPLASLRFSVPAQGDIGAKVKFHFAGLGYELVDEQPGAWIFQRGTAMGGILGTDVRDYPTRLTVRTMREEDNKLLVDCHWWVRLMGDFATRRKTRILEDEGRELPAFLGGQIDEPADSSVSEVSFGYQTDSADEADDWPRDESQPVADRAAVDLVAVEDEISGPAIAMTVVGFLMMVGHGIAGLAMASSFDPMIDEMAILTVPGIFFGLGMLVGGIGLHQFRSPGWAQVGIIAGFLPLSPACPLTIIVSIWAMKVLSKPYVKRALRERKNQERDDLSRRQAGSPLSTDEGIDLVAVEDEVSGPAIAMIAVGLFTLIGLAAADVMILSNRSDPILVWLSIPGLLVGLGMLVGGLNLRGLQSRGTAQLGVIAGFLPVSPVWLLSLPICLWANSVHRRPHVKQAFLERARRRRDFASLEAVSSESSDSAEPSAEIDLFAIEYEVNGPAIVTIVVGLLTFIFHALVVGYFLLHPSNDEGKWLAIPGLLVGLGIVVGGLNLKGLRSRGWAQLGLIAGFLPLSPAWILTAGVCLWANSILRRPHVKRAFLERARQHRREWRSAESNPGRKPVKKPLLLFLFLLTAAILIGLGMALNSLQPTPKEPQARPGPKPTATPSDKPPNPPLDPVAPLGGSELHDAAAQGDIGTVNQLLDDGVDVNEKNFGSSSSSARF